MEPEAQKAIVDDSTSPGVSAERSWMLPGYTMSPKAEAVKMLRALVNLSRDLADDIAEACGTLKTKGGATKHERRKIKTGVGY